MSDQSPLSMIWDGEALVPASSFWAKRADDLLTVGGRYLVEAQEPRSLQSHNHYFACLHDAWANLPEHLAEQYPTAEKLRKHALIRTGYRDERSFVCASKAEALRLAAFLKPIDDYAVVVVRECTVIQLTAQSQSKKAMGGKRFQESKTAVLDWIATLIGTDPATLKRNAEAA